MKEVQVYSPATVANISCGFDVLGMALNYPGDKMFLRKSHNPGVRITKILGANLPISNNRNIVGVVLENLLEKLPKNNKYGIEVEIYKGINPGSGIGSSAASAAGAAVGGNLLFGNYFKTIEIISFALEGEKLASGEIHADNVAPAILGGITLVKDSNSLEIISLPSPKNLWVTILHPLIEMKTKDARNMLKDYVSMKNAVRQWGHLGAFVSAVYREDYRLISRSLKDFIVEPIREKKIFNFGEKNILNFDELKFECKKVGALGGGISGSGPSVFMLSDGKEIARRVADRMHDIYKNYAIKSNIKYKIYISTVSNIGVQAVFTN